MTKYSIYLLFLSFFFIQCSKKTAMVSDNPPTVTETMTESWRSMAPKAGPARKIQLGDYSTFDLENGLKVVVVENNKLPRVSYQLSLRNEPINEYDMAGYVSMAGDQMSKGTKKRSKAEIDEAIDFIGANLNTSGGGVFASSLTKHKDMLLDLMTDVLYNPTFPEDEFEKAKKQTLSGLATTKTDPNAIAGNVAQVLNYGKDHPYGEIQTEETTNNITREKLIEYHRNYFLPNNAYLVIVGDVNYKEAKMTAEKYFGSWKAGKTPMSKYGTPISPKGRQVSFANKDGAVQSVIRVTYPVDMKPGSADVIPARVMNSILGGGIFSGRLMQNLREDKAYTYGARSSLSSDRLIGNFNASASVRNEVTDSSVTEFLYEMERMSTEPVTMEDLQLTKNSLAGGFARSLESPQTIARFALNTFRYNLPKDYYNTYLERLDAVGIADVTAMAQKYIRPNNAHIVVVGSKDDVSEKLTKFDSDGYVEFFDAFGNIVKMDDIAVPEGITAQNIIDDYLQALGGDQEVRAIKTMHNVSSVELMGQSAEILTWNQAPDKFAMKMNMQGMTMQEQKFDGKTASMGGMGQMKTFTEGDEFMAMKEESVMFPQAYYKEKGYTIDLKGIESVEGASAYKLIVTSPSGKKSTDFYDVKSNLLIRSVKTQKGQDGSDVTITTDIADYKNVSGIMVPHKVTLIGAMPVPLVMNITKVEFDQPIADDVFMIK